MVESNAEKREDGEEGGAAIHPEAGGWDGMGCMNTILQLGFFLGVPPSNKASDIEKGSS